MDPDEILDQQDALADERDQLDSTLLLGHRLSARHADDAKLARRVRGHTEKCAALREALHLQETICDIYADEQTRRLLRQAKDDDAYAELLDARRDANRDYEEGERR